MLMDLLKKKLRGIMRISLLPSYEFLSSTHLKVLQGPQERIVKGMSG